MKNVWSVAALGSLAILFAGCPEKPIKKTVRIELHLNEDGSIDDSHHDLVKVGPGFRVEFGCACEGFEDARFWVEDLRHLGEIGATVDHLAQLDVLFSDLARIEAAAPIESEAGEEAAAAGDAEAVMAAEAAKAAEAQGIQMQVRQLAPRLWGERKPELDGSFGDGWQGQARGRSEAVLTGPYAAPPGDHLFKFTWVVQHGDDPPLRWDPHIAGMDKYP